MTTFMRDVDTERSNSSVQSVFNTEVRFVRSTLVISGVQLRQKHLQYMLRLIHPQSEEAPCRGGGNPLNM